MTVLLAEMTWPEVERAVAKGATTVLLPLGATEQHGPHLPLGTDTFRAAALAAGVAAMPGILVAPALPFGCSDEHSGFAGLIGVDHATLAQVIVDCGWRMAAWGVRRLLLLSAHGGNDQALKLACSRLHAHASGLAVVVLPFSGLRALQAIAAADGIGADAVGLHAGDGETSEMLALRPDLVRMERAEAGPSVAMATIMPLLRQRGVQAATASGVLGDPCEASAGRGAAYLAAEVASFCGDVAGLAEDDGIYAADAGECRR